MKKSLWLIVGLVMALACAMTSEGADYAGWTVGDLWRGDGHATILRSTDSGVTWSRQGIGQVADAGMVGVVAVDPLTAWVVGEPDAGYATIYHTTDGGLTWDRKGSAAQVPNTQLRKVATFGDGNIWAVGDGTILHSGDGGATWVNQIPAGYESIQLQGIHTPDGVNVWATGGNKDGYATILKSSNGGLSWTRQSGGTSVFWITSSASPQWTRIPLGRWEEWPGARGGKCSPPPTAAAFGRSSTAATRTATMCSPWTPPRSGRSATPPSRGPPMAARTGRTAPRA